MSKPRTPGGQPHSPATDLTSGIRRFARWCLPSIICLSVICSLILSSQAQRLPPDVRFGAVEAFRDPIAAAEAGVGWERILFYWSELQPNGPDDWNVYHVPSDWLDLATSAGREVVGLMKNTPAWATDGTPDCGVPRGLDLPADDPGNLWATFVGHVVGMYAGRIDHWVIWNEPDIAPPTYGFEWCGSMDQYYQLLKVAYLAAHKVNPGVAIHLAGMTTWHDKTYLRRFLALARRDPTGPEQNYYFDVVTLHIYFQTETVPAIMGETSAALSAYGMDKPIWVNETNASPDIDPLWPLVRPCWRVSIEEQASFLLQSFALALANGADRIAVYKWLDNDLPPGGEPFGVMRPDFSHRPAFDAYRLLVTHYARTGSAREDRQSLHTIVTLDRGDLTTRVMWARTQSDAMVRMPALAARARLFDQTGAEQVIEPADGQYALTLPGARCPEEQPDCPVPHAACIIGGFTYLLVEDTGDTPDSPEGSPSPEGITTVDVAVTASLTSTRAVTTVVELPTPAMTATLTLTSTRPSTPTATPTSTLSPTVTPSPTAAPVDTPSPAPFPTDTPRPTVTPVLPGPTPTLRATMAPASSTPVWSIVSGVAGATLLAAAVGLLYKRWAK